MATRRDELLQACQRALVRDGIVSEEPLHIPRLALPNSQEILPEEVPDWERWRGEMQNPIVHTFSRWEQYVSRAIAGISEARECGVDSLHQDCSGISLPLLRNHILRRGVQELDDKALDATRRLEHHFRGLLRKWAPRLGTAEPLRGKEVLEYWWRTHEEENMYPTRAEREELARRSGKTLQQVTTFFQNRRNRKRQELRKSGHDDGDPHQASSFSASSTMDEEEPSIPPVFYEHPPPHPLPSQAPFESEPFALPMPEDFFEPVEMSAMMEELMQEEKAMGTAWQDIVQTFSPSSEESFSFSDVFNSSPSDLDPASSPASSSSHPSPSLSTLSASSAPPSPSHVQGEVVEQLLEEAFRSMGIWPTIQSSRPVDYEPLQEEDIQ